MRLRTLLAMGAVAGVMSGMSMKSAEAATFASFSFAGPSQFQLLPGGLFTVTTNVSFRFVGSGISGPVALPAVVDTDYNAVFQMTGTLVGGAGEISLLSGTINQLVNPTTFSFTGSSAPVLGMNLLSGSMTKGLMSGSNGGTTGGLNYSTNGVLGAPISFASDFITFQPGTRGATFGLSNLNQNSGGMSFLLNLGTLTPNDGDINPFDSSIAGSFDAEPLPTNVPEPGTMAMLAGFGVVSSLAVIRRRK